MKAPASAAVSKHSDGLLELGDPCFSQKIRYP
jgi:hypothetical protein